jgi:uncharacterized protein (DUF302 family)
VRGFWICGTPIETIAWSMNGEDHRGENQVPRTTTRGGFRYHGTSLNEPRRSIVSEVTTATSATGVVTKQTSRSVSETVAQLEELLESRGIKLFGVIDQQAEAQQVGLELRETTLVIFGNPAAGTPVMAASPLAAVDLPLKLVVWAGDDGGSNISYVTPAALAARHGLSADLAKNLAAIEILTDALVAS